MKKCIYCDKAIDDHFRICPYCGENQEYTTALPNRSKSYRTSLKEEKRNTIKTERPEHYTLLVFVFNSLLITGVSYTLIKQWKLIPLVFLVLMGVQGGLAFLAYNISYYGFKQERSQRDFFELVGDYSLPGILGGILLLLAGFVVQGYFLLFLLVLHASMILSASLVVLLGPAKRIYAVVVSFLYVFLILLFLISKWFGVGISFL